MAKIYWAGQSCFQISVSNGKDNSAEIVIDSFNANGGLKVKKLDADVLLITHDHPDHNYKENIKPADGKNYFLILTFFH